MTEGRVVETWKSFNLKKILNKSSTIGLRLKRAYKRKWRTCFDSLRVSVIG